MDELSNKREQKKIKEENNFNMYQILSRIKDVQDKTYVNVCHNFGTEEGKEKLQEYLDKWIQGKYAFLSNALKDFLTKESPSYRYMSLLVINDNNKFYEELCIQISESLRVPADQILFELEELTLPASILFYSANKGRDTGIVLYSFDNFVIECD